MLKLLILEDDVNMNNALKSFFEKNGYAVLQAFDCVQAVSAVKADKPDIIIADIGLPDGSGLNFCRQIKTESKKTPVIFLTARDEENDILDGYDSGCEEYITKPISPKILLKKLEAITQRRINAENTLTYIDLKIDYDKRRVWKGSTEIKLTSKEWDILNILSRNKGKIVTKDMLLEKIWDADGNFVDDHAVTVVINRLRQKIEKDTGKPEYIINIFGVGYTFGE